LSITMASVDMGSSDGPGNDDWSGNDDLHTLAMEKQTGRPPVGR
jgi:hypothetical protein